jgi:hypothetical protein
MGGHLMSSEFDEDLQELVMVAFTWTKPCLQQVSN